MRFWKRQTPRETVRVYDPDTRSITTIPAAELAPGMVRVRVEGQEGELWVDASKARMGEYRHPPFDAQVRAILAEIQTALQDVHPVSLEQWEDGFRRDLHAEREIAAWLHVSRVYRSVVGGRDASLAYRREVFAVLVSCMNNPRDKVLLVVSLQELPRQEAEAVIRAFYGG